MELQEAVLKVLDESPDGVTTHSMRTQVQSLVDETVKKRDINPILYNLLADGTVRYGQGDHDPNLWVKADAPVATHNGVAPLGDDEEPMMIG